MPLPSIPSNRKPTPTPSSETRLPYSPECMEGFFCGVHPNGFLGSSPRTDPPFARGWVAWGTGVFTPYYRERGTQQAGSSERTKGQAPTSEGSDREQRERRLIE